MTARIERTKTNEPFPIDVKRFYVPFVVIDKCPNCGREVHKPLDNDYLGYPIACVPIEVSMYCGYEPDDDELYQSDLEAWRAQCCNAEWDVHVVLDFTLTLAKSPNEEGT